MRLKPQEVRDRIIDLSNRGDMTGSVALNLELLLALEAQQILIDLVAQAGARLDLWSGGHLSDCEGECTCGYRDVLNTWDTAYHQYNQHRYGR